MRELRNIQISEGENDTSHSCRVSEGVRVKPSTKVKLKIKDTASDPLALPIDADTLGLIISKRIKDVRSTAPCLKDGYYMCNLFISFFYHNKSTCPPSNKYCTQNKFISYVTELSTSSRNLSIRLSWIMKYTPSRCDSAE